MTVASENCQTRSVSRSGKMMPKPSMQFCLNKITHGVYNNKDGLEFSFSIRTTELKIENSRIRIAYTMSIEGDEVSQQRIQFSFFKSKA